MKFKDRIKMLRRERHMTQSKLAEVVHKTEGAVRAWESGKAKPDMDTLIELAGYFHCTTDYLLGLEHYRNKEEEHELAILNKTFNETMSKIPNGKELFEDLVHFLEFTDMDNYEAAIFNFLKASQLFLSHFSEMQKLRDQFNKKQIFDLDEYLTFLTNTSTISAMTNRLMHIVSTVPICSLLQQTKKCGSPNDWNLAWKMYLAYYERFIYEIPSKQPYRNDLSY